MKQKYILSFLTAGLLLTGCSKENPFPGGEVEEGQFLKSALSMDLKVDESIRKVAATRADGVNIDDFNVLFYKDGSKDFFRKYKYGEMPDVVSLPQGTYTVTASYGEDRIAEWENPYYVGNSESFEIEPYEITSYVEPIECRLANVMVTVEFDPILRQHMSEDSYVEVKVGQSSALKYGIAEADAEKAGHFRHTAETTLAATFYGDIDGKKTVETKSLKNIEKGNHYKIRFKLHNGSDGDDGGDINGGIKIDADVTVTDVERNVSVEDELLDDNERPKEDDPQDPDKPGPDDPKPAAPTVVADAPVDLDAVNDGNALTSCVLHITSSAEGGFTALTCDIDSPSLTEEELGGIGLAKHLDLVNTPAELEAPLQGLGFPIHVGGKKEALFDISTFIPLLGALGGGEHHFVLTVSDANGTTEKILKIKF